MTAQMWISILSAIIGGAGVVFGVMRGRKADSDTRIDERIKLAIGVPLAKIEADVSALRALLPGDLSGRVHTLEQASLKKQKDLDEVFQRLRVLEGNCARHGVEH